MRARVAMVDLKWDSLLRKLSEHVPELVTHSDDEWAVSYGNATALLVEAVKELSDKVSALEDKLNS